MFKQQVTFSISSSIISYCRLIVTRGPSSLKSRYLFDTSSKNFGSVMKAAYFDCEMDLNEGRAVGSTVSAFLPWNKTPKTPWSLVILGLRQVSPKINYFR